jgi:hypothetical protein
MCQQNLVKLSISVFKKEIISAVPVMFLAERQADRHGKAKRKRFAKYICDRLCK